ncbi:SEC14-like protein 4 [Orchesella cincta]|uniref:SEC14-like protein 4 n=1 Tax=Orchesella cincta TaxID=48709 RepID=A0A1D2N1F2_ORCCI|nr:SEC14-like protein 4 [Orchesella cincta]
MFSITDEKEQAIFDKFRTKMAELEQDDYILIRFLRARNHDLDKAEEMLRKSVEWRRAKNISEFLQWKPSSPKFEDHSPFVCTGLDKEGSAVIYAPFGRWDTRHKLEQGLREDCYNYTYYMLENIMYHIRNSKNGKMTFIADQAGLSYWNVAHVETGQVFFAAFKTFEQNYPEILKVAYVINAPWLFQAVFKFLRPVFTGNTLSKINIFNGDKGKYVAEMRKLIPEESMPSECIGMKKC